MRVMKIALVGSVVLWGFFLLPAVVRAGGPLFFNEEDGQPYRWTAFDDQGQVIFRAVFFIEPNDLGTVPNQVAADAARKAFQTWEDVGTAALQIDDLDVVAPDVIAPFKKNLTAADFISVQCDALGDPPFEFDNFECELIRACVAQNSRNCPSPVIFDSDGGIFDALGVRASVLGFSGPLLAIVPPPLPGEPPLFSIVQARTFINGLFFDNNPDNSSDIDDPTGTLFLPGLLTHESGHFLGLAHSNVNGDTQLLNGAVSQVGTTSTEGGAGDATFSPVDGLVATDADSVETMYPFIVIKISGDGTSPQNTLEKDDQVALSTLYPSSSFASTGTIAGRVFFPDGTNAQGVVVIARNIDAGNSDSVLREAVSQFSGNTFAPRRCTGEIDLDSDGNGSLNEDEGDSLVLFGEFAACDEIGEEGNQKCSDQIVGMNGFVDNNPLFFNRFLQNSPQGKFIFVGRCGFYSFGASDPRPVGDEAENRFVLKGLPPGKYLIQTVPSYLGGFSSPVLPNLLLGLNNFVGPSILSNDNVNFAFFPNPQVGEFYNGEKEAGNAADNPFAYVPVEVTAGGRVDNVNIVLNTSPTRASLFSDPGFNFCGLGDVNRDGIVDPGDIFAVVQAQAAFDKDGSFNPRADINEDESVTFLDVDNITDIVTVPQPFDASSSSELKRGLAPFAAICTAARDGGCRFQAPVETIQDNGTPDQAICDAAKAVGCQVIECPQ